jgi:hypothetical protein
MCILAVGLIVQLLLAVELVASSQTVFSQFNGTWCEFEMLAATAHLTARFQPAGRSKALRIANYLA